MSAAGVVMISRRGLFAGAAASTAAAASAQHPKLIAVSSSNGLRCTAKAAAVMKAGGDTLDAAVAGVNIQEIAPKDASVGYGGLLNEEGDVDLTPA